MDLIGLNVRVTKILLTNVVKIMDNVGIEAQISAAFRHDIWLPRKYVAEMPKAAAIVVVAISIPRILGSLKSFFFHSVFKTFSKQFYFTDDISPKC